MPTRSADRPSCLFIETGGHEFFESTGPADDRTIPGDTEQVVTYAVALRELWLARDVVLRIEKINRRYRFSVRKIESLPREVLKEEPNPAVGLTGGATADIIHDS
jgi:hypothetical protein